MFQNKPLEGAILDNCYHLNHKLGQGAFGVVYAAEQLFLDEVIGKVAIKFLSPPTDEARMKVLEEVRAMARLSHPNLLSFRTAGVVDLPGYSGDLFLVCELASESLDQTLKNRLLSAEETLALAKQLALALEYLETSHCVHRDLKPANVLKVGDQWKIADFGLARMLENTMSVVSYAGGTPLFMAPEAWRGHISPSVDIWALGAILQQAFANRLPYERCKTQDAFLLALRKNPPYIAPDMPQPLRQIIEGCLCKDPARRWKAHQVVQALNVLNSSSTPVPRTASSVAHKASIEEIHVAADGSGDYMTISEAIHEALGGETIYVADGFYRESLIIDKDLHLVGEGVVKMPVVESVSGNVCKIEGGEGTISGLKFQGSAAEIGKRYFAVNAQAGNWKIENCLITSDTLAALRIGGSATLRAAGCYFQSTSMDGVLIDGGQCITLLNCTARGSGRHGVNLKGTTQQRTKFQGCIIEENGSDGILIEAGQIEIEKCSISLNNRAGIELKAEAHAEISRCRFTGNKAQGLIAAKDTTGEVTSSVFNENRFGAFDVPRQSLFARRNNKE